MYTVVMYTVRFTVIQYTVDMYTMSTASTVREGGASASPFAHPVRWPAAQGRRGPSRRALRPSRALHCFLFNTDNRGDTGCESTLAAAIC
jgi:hypothetical protein